jgi:hypothetical protein
VRAETDTVELDPGRVEARVDVVLVDDEPIPALVVVDGAVAVELPGADPVAARQAACRIARAAWELADQLAVRRPSVAG